MRSKNSKDAFVKLQLEALILLGIAVSTIGLASGCQNFSGKPKTTKPPQNWSGKAGESPKEVYQHYDWTIVDRSTYYCIRTDK